MSVTFAPAATGAVTGSLTISGGPFEFADEYLSFRHGGRGLVFDNIVVDREHFERNGLQRVPWDGVWRSLCEVDGERRFQYELLRQQRAGRVDSLLCGYIREFEQHRKRLFESSVRDDSIVVAKRRSARTSKTRARLNTRAEGGVPAVSPTFDARLILENNVRRLLESPRRFKQTHAFGHWSMWKCGGNASTGAEIQVQKVFLN